MLKKKNKKKHAPVKGSCPSTRHHSMLPQAWELDLNLLGLGPPSAAGYIRPRGFSFTPPKYCKKCRGLRETPRRRLALLFHWKVPRQKKNATHTVHNTETAPVQSAGLWRPDVSLPCVSWASRYDRSSLSGWDIVCPAWEVWTSEGETCVFAFVVRIWPWRSPHGARWYWKRTDCLDQKKRQKNKSLEKLKSLEKKLEN